MVTIIDRVEHLPLAQLKPAARNPRTHSPAQIAKIAKSIERFGFLNPILVDRDDRVIAGHGRVEAAKLLRLDHVPVVRIEHLTGAEKRAYVIADNRLAELAGWDKDILRLELGELTIEAPELDLTVTGYEVAEIDQIVIGTGDEIAADGRADAVPAIDRDRVVSRKGDVWCVGSHRIACGDARDFGDVQAVMQQDRARLVLTDPPYNVRIDGHARGKGRRRFEAFAIGSGELSQDAFRLFLSQAFDRAVSSMTDGGIAMVFMDWRHLADAMTAGDDRFSELLNLCVWAKTNAGMGSLYRSQHELVLVWKVGKASHVNNIDLGRFGRWRSNVWRYAGANAFGPERDDLLELHPTVKPVVMLADAILDVTAVGDVVFDPFAGSGSTLVAAEKTGRRGRGIEIDPAYVDVAVRRLERFTGTQAWHAESGLTLDETAEARSVAGSVLSTSVNLPQPLPRVRLKAGRRAMEA